MQSFDVDPNDTIERKKRRSKEVFDASTTKRRLNEGVVYSSSTAPPTLAGGRLGQYYLPITDPANLGPEDPHVMRYVRDYNMALEVVRAMLLCHEVGCVSGPEWMRGNVLRCGRVLPQFPKTKAMDNFLLVLDSAQFSASITPLKAAATLTKIKTGGVAAATAFVVTRTDGSDDRSRSDDSGSDDSDSDAFSPPPPPVPVQHREVAPVEFDEEN